jgi:hypothetical protein
MAGIDKLQRDYFDSTGVMKSWIIESLGGPSLTPEEVKENNFLLIVDDGVTRGQSSAVSLASSLGLYVQCKFGKNENGEEELKLLQPTQKDRDHDQLPKVIEAGHLFALSEFRVIHICLPKTPIFLGDSTADGTDGLMEKFISQVSSLLGVLIGFRLIGTMLVGLQAGCKQLTKANFNERITVKTVQVALGRKLGNLAKAWNDICRGEDQESKPPLVVGVIGVPDSSLQQVKEESSGFLPERLVTYSTTHLEFY